MPNARPSPSFANLNAGKRAALSALWNVHHSLTEVAARSGVPEAVLEEYFKTRNGYPGAITGPKTTARTFKPRVSQQVKSHHLTAGRQVPVTLPRISCLEQPERPFK